MIPPVSVIIVSRGRPDALLTALAGVAQSDHPTLEVVVVACPAGVSEVRKSRFQGQVKLAEFDEPNISRARNLGLALAAAPVVAFLDDDAVPEPTWASRLAAPFADPKVAQAGGYVRGRNGISFQWTAMEVDATGADHSLGVPVDRVSLHLGRGDRAVKTQGTCCAFRRDVLADAGGFDPAFRFYLDEADVNLRLAATGQLTAVVPMAQVVHGYAASPRRRPDRVPLDLGEIGASFAAFLRRHAPTGTWAGALAGFLGDQRRRLMRHMVSGGLEPGEVRRMMRGLENGLEDGLTNRPPTRLAPIGPPLAPFCAMPGTGPRPGWVILSTPGNRAEAETAARTALAAGAVVTLLQLSKGARAHWLGLRADGIWVQAGGVWGRSDRAQPRLQRWSFAQRAVAEAARLASMRPADHILSDP
ncbi:MAG: glycosyltransferase [Gemmobacter sp.]|nr:glycosyltransferase [Gemmobacter sp.]